MTVYSTKLISQLCAAGSTLTYTVPAGYVCVVRDISITPEASGLTLARVFAGGNQIVFSVTSGVLNVTQSWEGRQVFNAGETIEASATGAGVYFMVSGYLLN